MKRRRGSERIFFSFTFVSTSKENYITLRALPPFLERLPAFVSSSLLGHMPLSMRATCCRGQMAPLAPGRTRSRLAFLMSSSSSSSMKKKTSTSSLPPLPPRRSPNNNNSVATATTISSFQTATEDDPATTTTPNFNWARQWYPCLCAVTTDFSKPHACQVLGRDLVLWKDKISGEWRANDDACPHRLAPLSEGRIEVRKGKGGGDCESCVLACAYHGEKVFFSFIQNSLLFFLPISFFHFSSHPPTPLARATNQKNSPETTRLGVRLEGGLRPHPAGGGRPCCEGHGPGLAPLPGALLPRVRQGRAGVRVARRGSGCCGEGGEGCASARAGGGGRSSRGERVVSLSFFFFLFFSSRNFISLSCAFSSRSLTLSLQLYHLLSNF